MDSAALSQYNSEIEECPSLTWQPKKSEETCWTLSVTHCAWYKRKGKVVDIAGSSVEIWGGRTDPTTPLPAAACPLAAESSEGKEGISSFTS